MTIPGLWPALSQTCATCGRVVEQTGVSRGLSRTLPFAKPYSTLKTPSNWKEQVRFASRSSIDTYKIVRSLERNSFTREQSVAIMRVLDELLLETSAGIRRQSVSRPELENSVYKFRSRLHDLREELQLARTGATSELRNEIAALASEISQSEHKLNEAMAQLKFELSVEHSNRKAEEAEQGKALEGKTLDLQQQLAVHLADLRTTSETMKMESTRKLAVYVLLGVVATVGLDQLLPPIVNKFGWGPVAQTPTNGEIAKEVSL